MENERLVSKKKAYPPYKVLDLRSLKTYQKFYTHSNGKWRKFCTTPDGKVLFVTRCWMAVEDGFPFDGDEKEWEVVEEGDPKWRVPIATFGRFLRDLEDLPEVGSFSFPQEDLRYLRPLLSPKGMIFDREGGKVSFKEGFLKARVDEVETSLRIPLSGYEGEENDWEFVLEYFYFLGISSGSFVGDRKMILSKRDGFTFYLMANSKGGEEKK